MKRISDVYSEAVERVCMSCDGDLTSEGASACVDRKSDICPGCGSGANLALVRLNVWGCMAG